MDNSRDIATPQAKKFVLSRRLPKTGQVTSYAAGDDGALEAGWWKGRLNADNKTRLLARTIGGDDVVFDRATGLMWAADGNDVGCNAGNTDDWPTSLAVAAALDFAGYTDWRLPNVLELCSILVLDAALPTGGFSVVNQAAFPNTVLGQYWASTTHPSNTLNAKNINFTHGNVTAAVKTSDYWMRAVRGGL